MVVTIDKVIENQTLMLGNSAEKAELIVCRRGTVLSQRKEINMYMDFKYAFMVVHGHEAIWKGRELLTSGNKDAKHAKEV